MVVSFEFGMQKSILVIFSLVLLLLGLYPLIIPKIPNINFFDPSYTNFIIAIIALLQIFFVFRMRRPRIY